MLVMKLKKEEKILIGDSIEITICRIKKGSVRFGIEAPKDVVVNTLLKKAPAPEKPATIGELALRRARQHRKQ